MMCNIFWPLVNFAQMHPPIIKKLDIDQDGVFEEVKYEKGLNNTWQKLSITSKKNDQKLSYEASYNLDASTTLYAIPDPWLRPENKPFLKYLGNRLFKGITTKADPSLQWILDGYLHSQQLTNHPYLEKVIPFIPRWQKGKVKLPDSYSMRISADSAQKISKGIATARGYWLFYNGLALSANFKFTGNRHKIPKSLQKGIWTYFPPKLDTALTSKYYQILSTPHMVLMRRGKYYAWVFVQDTGLTRRTKKLRHPSIHPRHTQLKGDLLIISNLTSNHQLVIDLKNGVCAQLKAPTNDIIVGTSFQKKNLVIKYSQHKSFQQVPLVALKKELAKYTILPKGYKMPQAKKGSN